MYTKYAPRIVSKIVNVDVFDALDYVSKLNFYI